jgi:hypothetical protein
MRPKIWQTNPPSTPLFRPLGPAAPNACPRAVGGFIYGAAPNAGISAVATPPPRSTPATTQPTPVTRWSAASNLAKTGSGTTAPNSSTTVRRSPHQSIIRSTNLRLDPPGECRRTGSATFIEAGSLSRRPASGPAADRDRPQAASKSSTASSMAVRRSSCARPCFSIRRSSPAMVDPQRKRSNTRGSM